MAAPIQAEYRQLLNEIARALDHGFNERGKPTRIGFVLLMAETGKIDGGRVNYISNSDRGDMLTMMKEFIARAEGRYSEEGGHA